KTAFEKLASFSPTKKFVLWQAGKQVIAKTHGHYPAALETLNIFRDAIGKTHEEHLELVTAANAKLGNHQVTRELVRLFFLSEQAKKLPLRLNAGAELPDLQHAPVIGAGAMGAGIALLMAQ